MTQMNTPADFPKSLEDYKSAVYNYLTQKLGISAEVARSRMDAYEPFDEYWNDRWEVSATATAIMFGF